MRKSFMSIAECIIARMSLSFPIRSGGSLALWPVRKRAFNAFDLKVIIMLLQLVLCKHASAEYKTNVMRTKTQYTIFSVRILMFVVLRCVFLLAFCFEAHTDKSIVDG